MGWMQLHAHAYLIHHVMESTINSSHDSHTSKHAEENAHGDLQIDTRRLIYLRLLCSFRAGAPQHLALFENLWGLPCPVYLLYVHSMQGRIVPDPCPLNQLWSADPADSLNPPILDSRLSHCNASKPSRIAVLPGVSPLLSSTSRLIHTLHTVSTRLICTR
jgi:hypothetical protein